MKTLLLALIASSALAAEPLVIEEYDFTWKVAESGKVRMLVVKDQDATTIRIVKEYDSISILPTDAKAVGAGLAQTDKFYAKLKGSQEDAREEIAAGDQRITFWNSPKFGFNVSIGEKESLVGRSIMLDRKQCAALAPHLKRAEDLAAHVDKVIDAALAPKP